MSHFTVLVIGDNIEAQLAPFQENNTGDLENPNTKWDWYVIGGRWTGFFKVKHGHADQARKCDIDFDGMRAAAEARALSLYELAAEILKDIEPNESWNSLRERFQAEGKTVEEARKAYWAQPRVKVFSEDERARKYFGPISKYPDLLLTDRSEVGRIAHESAISTFAVLKNGKWYEKGGMGWWCVVHNEKEQGKWNREFSTLLDSLPDDALLTVVDCHI